MHLFTRLAVVSATVLALFLSESLQAQQLPSVNDPIYTGGNMTAALNATQDSLIITVEVFYTCPTATTFPDTLGLISLCNSTTLISEIPQILNEEVSDVCASSFPICGSGLGDRRIVYQGVISMDSFAVCNLSTSPATFRVYPHNRLDADNLNNPSTTNDRLRVIMEYYFGVDDLNTLPSFGAQGRPYVCGGVDVDFDPQVTEADGDSMVFVLRQPQRGIATGIAIPYATGFSLADPFGTGTTIDSETGILSFTAPDSGIYQVVIEVREYDRATGDQIGMVLRDFQFMVDGGCSNPQPTVAASLSNVTGGTLSGNYEVTLDTGVASSFSLVFTGGAGETVTAVTTAASALPGAIVSTNTVGNVTTLTVSWTPGAGDVGTHVFSISAEDNGCDISGKSAQKIVVIVQEAAQPFVVNSVSTSPLTCESPANGQMTINFSGGTGPYTFAVLGSFTGFTDTNSTGVFTNLVFDVYSIYAIDSGSLVDTTTGAFFTVTQNPLNITSVTTQSNVSCDDACDGAMTVNHSGGQGPFTYAWSQGQTTKIVTGLCGANTVVTVTDNIGCAVDTAVYLLEPPVIFAELDSSFDVTCNGGNDGQAFVAGHGGVAASTTTDSYILDQTEGSHQPYPYQKPVNVLLANYSELNLGDDQTSAANNIGFNFDFFGTTYTQFTIASNGYIGLGATGANGGSVFNSPAMPNAAAPNNIIAAYWDDLNPAAGGQIAFYRAGVAPNRVLIVNFIDVPHFANAGITATFQVVLHENSDIIEIYCTDCNTDNGGGAVQGIEGNGTTQFLVVPGRNNVNFSAANDYVAFIPSAQSFTYTWSSIGSGASATNLTAGNYTVTVANGVCTDTVSFTILEADPIVIDTTLTTPSCVGDNDGAIAVSASGGSGGPYTFLWSTGSTSATITNLTAGTYTVTVTDAASCTEILAITLSDPTALTASINVDDQVSCFGGNDGQLTANGAGGTGGYTFLWSNASTNQTISGLIAGTYTVTVTDANGCEATDSETITAPTALAVSIASSTNVSCVGGNDGAATAGNATGGTPNYTYLWNTGGTTQTITGLTAGTYTVTATDANGCTATDDVVITEPATGVSISIASSTDVSCNGGSNGSITAAAPSGGTSPYALLWSTGSTAATISGLSAGTFTVTVTDNGGCTATATETITEPTELIVATTSTTNPTCAGSTNGSITVAGSGGTPTYSFLWSTGATTATISSLAAGTYTVTLTDNNACTDVLAVTLTDGPGITAAIAVDELILCNGDNTGELTASATGGTAPLTFLWSNAATSAAITGLVAGTYTVTVTDANGCDDVASVTLTQPTALSAAITSSTNVSCLGGNDGEATAAGSGGTAPYDFLWSNAATTATITGLAAGTYTVTITDDNGCTATDDVVITEPATGITASATSTNVTCFGQTNGTASASGSGGTTPYTFLWSTGSTNANITGLGAGTYTVTVSDVNGCSGTASVVITSPAFPVIAVTSTDNVTCFGALDGEIQAFLINGTGPFTYLWSTGATTQTVSGLGVGTYTVTVTDVNGCSDDQSDAINGPTAVSLSVSSTDPSCNGNNDGSIAITASGGAAPYTFAWSNSATTSTITSLAAGTYTVTVTDDNNCTAEETVVLTNGAGIAAAITLVNDPSCAGTTTGSIAANGANASLPFSVSYLWNTGSTSNVQFNLAAGTYTVTVTDNNNGCEDDTTITLSDPPVLSVSIIDSLDPSCGNSDGEAEALGSGGTGTLTYAWSSGGTSALETGLGGGIFTVVVTDGNGCEDSTTVTLVAPVSFTATGVNLEDESCAFNDGEATVNLVGGTSPFNFVWSNAATTQTITGLAAGTYTVTVTDVNNCEETATVIIADSCTCNWTATGVLTNDALCNGEASGAATVTHLGAAAPVSYLWSNGATTNSITNVLAGTYSVIVTDIDGCEDTATVIIDEPVLLEITSFTNIAKPACDNDCDGTATVNATGGTGTLSFLWSSGGTTAAQTGLCGGGHFVTVTDANGCEVTDVIALVETPVLFATVDSTDSVSCVGGDDGEAYLSAHGGLANSTSTASYIIDQTEGTFEPYPTGRPWNAINYKTVTLQDDATSDTINIFDGDNFSFFGVNKTHFIINSQGFITFDLSNPNSGQVNGQFSVTSAIPSAAAGTPSDFIAAYWHDLDPSVGNCTLETYLVGDAPNRIRVVNFIEIDHFANTPPNIISTFQIVLYESSNIIQIHSDSLNSDGGGHVQGIENAAGTSAFAVPGRNNTNFSVVNDYVAFIPSIQNFTYTWSSIGSGASATNLTAGSYTVTVSDGTCQDILNFDIEEPANAFSVAMTSFNSFCFVSTGQAIANVSNGVAPYEYVWSNASTNTTTSTSDTITGLSSGPYTVTVTDDQGCEAIGSVIVDDFFAPAVSASGEDASCDNSCDGTAIATFNCFTCGPAEWFIFPDTTTLIGTGDTITNLCPETYLVRITTAFGCSNTDTITVGAPAPLILTMDSTDESCNGAANGTASVSASGGTATYTFLWNTNATTASINGLVAGNYTVTVTDNNGCEEIGNVTVGQNSDIIASATLVQDVSCNGGNDGQAIASQTGGVAPYTYTWSNASTNATLSNVAAGTYTVTVSDVNGCEDIATVVVDEPDTISIAFTETPISCGGTGNDGALSIVASGGTSGYSFLWNNASTASSITGLTAGTYCVTVTDANGCINDACFTLDPPGSFTVAITDSADVSCFGGADGFAVVQAISGGSGTYSFLWDNATTSSSVTNLTAGLHSVTVTDLVTSCVDTAFVTIGQPTQLVAQFDLVDSVNCLGGSDGEACASATGGTGPYTFAWSSGATATCAANLPAGTYTVTITDANDCEAIIDTIVGEPATGVVASIATVTPAQCAGDSATVTASAVGGSGTYTFLWPNGSTAAIQLLPAGTYCVTVNDGGACEDTACVVVTDPDTISIAFTETPISCSGSGNDGGLSALASGGTSGYTFLWNTGSTNSSITGLIAGTYCVTVTDANSCNNTACFTLDPPTPLIVNITDSGDVSCFGGSDGFAEVQAISGGSGTYSFLWDNAATTSSVNNLSAGIHSVTVTDLVTGCVDSDSVTIDQPTQLVAQFNLVDSVNCLGGSDGEACASATGGTGPYTFAWSSGATATCAANLPAGTYTVTITDANDCEAIIDTIVGEPATGVVASIATVTPAQCAGDSATVTASAVGGSGTYTFLWPNGSTAATQLLPAGTYCVTVNDGGACEDTACVVVTDPAPVSANGITTSPSCPGGNDGSIAATGNGGTPGYTFVWSTGSTNQTITGLTAGTYTVTTTDANGCSGVSVITLLDPVGMSAVFSNINTSACGTCNGSATAVISGGAAPFDFTWLTGGSTTATGIALCSGINQVVVEDANGCLDTFAVNVPSLGADTVFAATLSNTSCNGGADGVAVATYVCNTAPCTVAWFDLGTNTLQGTADTVNGLSAGDYYVQLTNDSGCVSFDTITITEPSPVVASIVSSNNVSCIGGNDGSATAAGAGGTPGYTFLWPSGATTAAVSGLTAGTYCVTVFDVNGCEDTACVIIDEPATGLSVTAVLLSNVLCNGGNDGSVTASASGGTGGPYTFTWNGTLVTDTLTNITAGQYIVVVSDGSACSASDTVVVTSPVALSATFNNITQPSCPGDNDGEATITAAGGAGSYSYLWPSGGTAQTEASLVAGTYCVTVTDANNCQDTFCVSIVDPASITNTFTGITTSSCTVCDGTATANPAGGSGSGYSFIWDNGQTTAFNDSLCAGINFLTITDQSLCSLVVAVPVNAEDADTVVATAIDPTCGSCDGQVIAVYNCTSAPCTVEWTNITTAAVIGTTDTITGLCEGTYAVELTNALGCVSSDVISIVAPDLLLANANITDESCFGACDGSIGLSPTGGSGTYSFVWSNAATSANISGLCAGIYTVTISDGAGCDSIFSFTVGSPTAIVANTTVNDASCFGVCDGEINVLPSGGAGGYSFNWTPVPPNGNGTSLATGLCAGAYSLEITDADGCTIVENFTIQEPAAIVQDSATLVDATCGVCDGSISAFISGGTGGLSYAWSNGAGTSIADTLCFGFYELTVTDASGCSETFGYPVSETGGPGINITGINASANGQCDGSATANVTSSLGTVVFVWSNGDTTATADTLCAGTYVVTATDTNGCSTVDTITITEPTLLTLDLAVQEITCAGNGCDGSITATIAGGVAPYSYLWSTGDTTATIDSLCAGTYTVVVIDANGQIIADSATLDDPTPFVIVSVANNISCPGACDGNITLNISNGGAPFTVLWNTGDTTTNLSGLCPGTYAVTIADTAGCSDSLSFTLTEPVALAIVVDSLTNPDCQLTNGEINVTASGGNGAPYGYLWLDIAGDPLLPIQATNQATGLGAGIYNVAVTDQNGCADTFNVILNNLNAADITLDSLINVSCFGECDGAIFTTISGGTSPYNILWSNGESTDDIDSLCAGADTIGVVDADFCLSFAIFQVTEPEELTVRNTGVVNVNCGSDCDGSITITMAGGTAPYSFAWSNGATDSTATDLCAGLYSVTVTDANGCTVITSASVGGPAPMVINLDSIGDATCTNTGDGFIAITVTGGTAPYSYLWIYDGTDTLIAQDLAGALAGDYVVQVTDANGCIIRDTFEIEAQFFVDVTAQADVEVCPGSTGIDLTGTQSGAASTRWLFANGVVIGNGNNVTVNATSDTNLFVFEGINGVCVARDTVLITWSAGPGIDAGPDRFIEPGGSTTIGGAPTANAGVDVVWTPAKDISGITEANPTVNPLETTVYYVSATDDEGCFGIDSVLVTVEEVVDPVGGFSPNGDGVNEFFIIDRIGNYPNAIVQIFNRWGNLIFESAAGYPTPWDGTFNGKELPVGTYYYIIDLKDPQLNNLVTGPVTILK